jgi:4-hydroxy-tetrahydrodipicolinate synthase
MRAQVQICLNAKVAGIAALGLATEVAKLSFAERQTVMDWVAQDVAGRVPLGFTITGASVAEQVGMVRHAESVGANWLILQPPAVGNYGAEEYLNFFARVMRSTPLPVAIQNAPQYLGRGLSDDDITRLRADHANFTLIKSESSAEGAAKLIAMAGPSLKVFNGRGGLEMIECLDAGCEGFLLAPELIDHAVQVMHLYDAGNRVAALALHQKTLPAITFMMQSIEHLICYGKRIFTARAGLPTFDRSPALRPTAEGLAEVATFAAQFGHFTGQP